MGEEGGERGNNGTCADCGYYFKNIIKFLISHIGLVSLVVGYTTAGGYAFMHLECQHELNVKREITDLRKNITDEIWNITNQLTVLNQTNWTTLVRLELHEYEKKLKEAIKEKGWDGHEETHTRNWTFSGALFYSIILITTIGYGHITPKTMYGKLVTIAYAIPGVPLMMLCLANIGDGMAHSFRFLYWRICCYACTKRPRKKVRRPPIRSSRSSSRRYPSQSGGSTRTRTSSFRRSNRASEKSGDSHLSDSAFYNSSYSDPEYKMDDDIESDMRGLHSGGSVRSHQNRASQNSKGSEYLAPPPKDDDERVAVLFNKYALENDGLAAEDVHRDKEMHRGRSVHRDRDLHRDKDLHRDRVPRARSADGDRDVHRTRSVDRDRTMPRDRRDRDLMRDRDMRDRDSVRTRDSMRDGDRDRDRDRDMRDRDSVRDGDRDRDMRDRDSVRNRDSMRDGDRDRDRDRDMRDRDSMRNRDSTRDRDTQRGRYERDRSSYRDYEGSGSRRSRRDVEAGYTDTRRSRSSQRVPRSRYSESPPNRGIMTYPRSMATPSRFSRMDDDYYYDDYDDYDDYDYEEEEKDNLDERPVPIWLGVLLVVLYIFGGAALFQHKYKWTFLDAVYFCFITLTTIGFGDLVPNQEDNLSIALCSIYLLFGIALLAMSFNLVQEEVINNVKSMAKKLGIIKEEGEEEVE